MTTITKLGEKNTITIKKIEPSKTDWNGLRKKLKKAGKIISEIEIQKEIAGYRLNKT